ncbi:MAG: DUF4934 domain-containing protein [Mediterranea sp.]|jgi:hypothetical protein|nr:DUF4934 domain-containing protein [Mediterranea sp.]
MRTKKTFRNKAQRAMFVLTFLVGGAYQSQLSAQEKPKVIDVERALAHPSKLNTSQLGSHVRYIPLETTDKSLIGNAPDICVLNKRILVWYRGQCLLFNKEDGKFVCEIGHSGGDPTAYSQTVPFYDDTHDWIYFIREPDKLIKYDINGHYLGEITLQTKGSVPKQYCFDGSSIIGYHEDLVPSKYALTLFNTLGKAVDNIPASRVKGVVESDILSFTMKKMGNMKFVLMKTKKADIATSLDNLLWKSNRQVRFMESLSDTVFTLDNSRLKPYVIFRTGKWRSGAAARMAPADATDRLMIGSVLESPKRIFFQCVLNISPDIRRKEEEKVYNVIYDKASGKTTMAPFADRITDDLSHGMPFCPQSVSTQGEYACLMQAADVLEWMDKHPEAKQQPWWEALKNLEEDDNPVAIIVSE